MPEALTVLFVMKIAKNQVDTPITILTCMHLILVTRGISSHKRHLWPQEASSLLCGEEANHCISGVQVRIENKRYQKSLLRIYKMPTATMSFARDVFTKMSQSLRIVGLTLCTSTICFLALSPAGKVMAAQDCDSFLSGCDTSNNCRQFYLGGIVGADFGTLNKQPGFATVVPNQSLFTGGGTLGMRYLRDDGAWRFEFEGRGRDQISETEAPPGGLEATTAARDGWSTMVNVWRDYKVVGDFNVYAGAGIGAGGYRSVLQGSIGGLPFIAGTKNVSSFAWQAGGGLIYDVSNRMAVDLGYRFFTLGDNRVGTLSGLPPTNPGSYLTNYSANELLLTIRIYEPFRRWR